MELGSDGKAPRSLRMAAWFKTIRRAHEHAWDSDKELAGKLAPKPATEDDADGPRVPESRQYWWIIRPYGRRFLAWEVIGVLVVMSHALGMVLWYGEHNAQLHNHQRCLAGGLGNAASIAALDTVALVTPPTVLRICATLLDATQSVVFERTWHDHELGANVSNASSNASAELPLQPARAPRQWRPFGWARRMRAFLFGWMRGVRERNARVLHGLHCEGKCADAAMDVVTGIFEGAPPQPPQSARPAWLNVALRLSSAWLERERTAVCRYLHPASPARGALERACRPPRRRLRRGSAVGGAARNATSAAPSDDALAGGGGGGGGGGEPEVTLAGRRLSRRALLRAFGDRRCIALNPPPQCARMCYVTDRLRIVSDGYNALNFALLFITAYRIPKRRRRALQPGAAAPASATDGAPGAPAAAAADASRAEAWTYEFSPRAIAWHRLTRSYLPLQLFLALPSYTLVVHAAGIYSPRHALRLHLKESLLTRVRADPAAAWRFLVRTGLAANFTKIMRGIRMLLMVIRNVKLMLKVKNMLHRLARAYRVLQERVALKRRVRFHWTRVREQRTALVSTQRSLLRRLTGNVSSAVERLRLIGPIRSTRLGRASLSFLRRRALLRPRGSSEAGAPAAAEPAAPPASRLVKAPSRDATSHAEALASAVLGS